MTPRRLSALALVLLALARVAGTALLLAMVHPDEFFQSQEVMAHHAIRDPGLRAQLWLPWEFVPSSPNRSVLFPALVAGLPYEAMRWLGIEPTGALLLLVPRLLLCGASFTIDAILYAIATKHQETADPMRAALCFASAWPTLVLLSRPFSNTLETLVLALCFAALLLTDPHARVFCRVFHRQTLLLGALLALGVFARFTFVFFFLPLGLELVRRQDALLIERVTKKNRPQDSSVALKTRVWAAVRIALQGLVAFTVVAAVIVVGDTLYFRPDMRAFASWRELHLLRRVVVAPLNNLRYNLQYEHLELHGVHARSTHAAVNLPLLFGLLPVQLLGSCVTHWLAVRRRSPMAGPEAVVEATNLFFGAASVLVPLACLSLAPHQEPRFLLPLTVPLHLYAASSLVSTRARALLWVAFNAILTVFFGVLHQGGVVPLLLAFSTSGRPPATSFPLLSACAFAPSVQQHVGRIPLVFYKTYMPPRFLLAGLATTPSFQVVDLAGGSDAAVLATQIGHVQALVSSPEALHQAFLAAPASVSIERITTSAFVRSASRVGRCTPHVSTEDFALDKPFALELYLLEMAATVVDSVDIQPTSVSE